MLEKASSTHLIYLSLPANDPFVDFNYKTLLTPSTSLVNVPIFIFHVYSARLLANTNMAPHAGKWRSGCLAEFSLWGRHYQEGCRWALTNGGSINSKFSILLNDRYVHKMFDVANPKKTILVYRFKYFSTLEL